MDKQILLRNLNVLANLNPSLVKELSSSLEDFKTRMKIFVSSDKDYDIIFDGFHFRNLKRLSRDVVNKLEKKVAFIDTWFVTDDTPISKCESSELFKLFYGERKKILTNSNALFILGTVPFFHIYEILKRHNFFPYLKEVVIYEPRLEFLYAFLSLIDIYSLAYERKINLHISLSPEELRRFVIAYGRLFPFVSYLKSYDSEQISLGEDVLVDFFRKSEVTVRYEQILSSLEHLGRLIGMSLPVFVRKSETILRNIPVCIVGSGPSLDDSIEFLKKNKRKFLIISLTTAVNTLVKNGIIPDFVVVSDTASGFDKFIPQEERRLFQESILLFFLGVSDSLVKKFSKKWIVSESYFKDLFEFKALDIKTGTTVLNPAFEFAVSLGANKIFLVGVDLGTKRKDTFHAEGYLGEDTDISRFNIEVEGNFGGKVYTRSDYYVSKLVLEEQIRLWREKIRDFEVFNLSDGAFIVGSKPISFDEGNKLLLRRISKQKILAEIKSFCFKTFTLLPSSKALNIVRGIEFSLRKVKHELQIAKSAEEIFLSVVSFYQYALYNSYGMLDLLFNHSATTAMNSVLKIVVTIPDSIGLSLEDIKTFVGSQLTKYEKLLEKIRQFY